MQQPYTLTTVTGASEVLITPAQARLIAVIPQGTAAGTAAVREAQVTGSGATARWTVPTGTVGTLFGGNDAGVAFAGGITLQLSNGADVFGVVWGPRL